MQEDFRPLELSGKPLHELSEQNLQEMEQSAQKIELHAGGRSEMEQPAQKIELHADGRSEMGAYGNSF